ncbi:hypothetical protein [Alloactinosynnema sp. L-07]|uniref:hypothetical protein n=1 Tax=Alloactinosynnema sp. L-07 TaxID=1653480 RepID=UPI00065EFE5A|nr:hypothetical protein [Alloactinosynnema sp. L-07]CRK56955.1 hypothetical protein [Alloactinosynnema sp. L-07]
MDTARLQQRLRTTHQARRGELVLVGSAAATMPTADALDTAEGYAERLSKSVLLPGNYRRQPANILWAVEFGRMLNIPTMAAITGVNVIEGKPTASASLIGYLVRRAGHRLRIRGGSSFNDPAYAEIIRTDDPDFVFRSDWTIHRAVESQLVRLINGKPIARSKEGKALPWERYTPALLKARTLTEVARDACQDVLFGLHYTPEELGAEVDQDGIPTGRMIDVDDTADYHFDEAMLADEVLAAARVHADGAPGQRERIVVVDAAGVDDEHAILDTTPFDWDAAIADAAAKGAQELRDLWYVARTAEPDNQELIERINSAGAQVAPEPHGTDSGPPSSTVTEPLAQQPGGTTAETAPEQPRSANVARVAAALG